MYSKKKLSDDKKDEILKELRENANSWFRYWKENNINYKFHVKFINGEQWEQETIDKYTKNGREIVTINKISPIMKQLLGEYRANIYQIFLRKVGIEDDKDNAKMQSSVYDNIVAPQQQQQAQQQAQQQVQQQQQQQAQQQAVSDISQLIKTTPVIPSDPKLKVYEGLLRQIGYSSDAEEVYFYAGKCALEGGFGAIQVLSDYEDGMSIKQKIKLKIKLDPTKCYWDIFAEHPSKIDGDYCGCITTISKKEFERLYPDVDVPTDFIAGDYDNGDIFWGDKDTVTIGEQYKKEYFKDNIFYNLTNGEMYYESDLEDEEIKQYEKNKEFEKYPCDNYKIIYYKFTSNEILDKTECPSKYPCIIFVDGNSYYKEREQITTSFIKDVVDCQKSLNFVASDIIQWLKLAKKSNWLVPIEVIPTQILQWWNDPTNPPAYLPYSGQQSKEYGIPQQIAPPKMPTDLIEQYNRLVEDIKQGLGRYEANIGATSNEQSGVAVANRSIQGSNTVTPYRENLRKAVIATGKIILSAMPRVYDDERVVTIRNRDGGTEEVPINKQEFDYKSMEYGLNIDMRKMGTWDIEVKAGASNALQKQQDIENMETLIKMDTTGQSYALLSPLLAEDLDSPKSKQIASRLTFLTPPQILAAEQGKKYIPPPNPAEAMQTQIMQMQMMQMQLENQKTQSDIQNDRIKAMADQIQAMAKMMEAKTEAQEVQFRQEIEPQKLMTELLHGESMVQIKEKGLQKSILDSKLNHHTKIVDKLMKNNQNNNL